jgi:hypothetical protein
MQVVVAPESPSETEAATTSVPDASRAAIDSPMSMRPRSICSPMNSGIPPSATKQAWARAPQLVEGVVPQCAPGQVVRHGFTLGLRPQFSPRVGALMIFVGGGIKPLWTTLSRRSRDEDLARARRSGGAGKGPVQEWEVGP